MIYVYLARLRWHTGSLAQQSGGSRKTTIRTVQALTFRWSARWKIQPALEELKVKARAAGLWNLWMPAGMAHKLQPLVRVPPVREASACDDEHHSTA